MGDKRIVIADESVEEFHITPGQNPEGFKIFIAPGAVEQEMFQAIQRKINRLKETE